MIICTEPGYNPDTLAQLAKEEPQLDYQDRYMDLISEIIKELLREGKTNKLQTFGYSLEGDGNVRQQQQPDQDIQMQGQHNDSVKVNFINLNKQCMITRNWEIVYLILGDRLFSHLYKEYTVFLKTRDESLVQVNGTNIFVYLNDKLGRHQQQQALADKPAQVNAGVEK